ncbi:hypothetical protein Tco_0445390 [Tanacetum coccineum]
MVMGMMVAFIGDGGGAWRYGNDGGDDLDGIVAVWWLRQQGDAKVTAVATGGQNLAGWRRRRQKIRRGGSKRSDSLPTHIPKPVANYVRPHLNTSVLDVMKNHLIKLFTQSSTSTDHDAINAQDVDTSFHKRSHDNQDPPNNREGENKKERTKDVGEPCSRSARQNKSLMVHAQVHTPAIQPLDPEDEYIRTHIDQNENHILGPSTIVIAKKLKEIIQKDELTIVDLEGAGLEKLKQHHKNDVELEYHVEQLKAAVLIEAKWNSNEDAVSKPRTFKRHMSKNTKPHPSFYNNNLYYLVYLSTKEKYTSSITNHYASRYYKQGIENMISARWSKETHRYIFEALNGIHHWEDSRIDFFKAEIIRRSDDNEYEFSYADLPRLSLNDVKDMYLLQVQDKLHHLPLEFVKDFNNALLIFIRRVVIQNRVEDIQLGMKSYQQTLNLTKPMMFFEGIGQKIPFTKSGTHKRIRENLVDIVKKNKLGTGNKRLKGRDWTDIDVEKSNGMVDKIYKTLKRREQLQETRGVC